MCSLEKRTLPFRSAFTLIELLVVMSIMILLAALAVAFIPNVAEAERTARGADRLQGWLLIARQQAKRDGVPTGIRLNPGTLYPNTGSPNPQYITDLQYIQKPGDFYQPGSSLTFTPGTTAVTAMGVDFTGNYTLWNGNPGAWPMDLWPVQRGDYLELQGGGAIHQISVAPTPTGPTTGTLTLASAIPILSSNTNPITTYEYRVIRSPRILNGESTLQLPQNVAIDTSTNTNYGNPLPVGPSAGTYDIVFSPTGAVVGTANDKIILWVRDVTLDSNSPGEQTLVTVYCRTGFIAAQPVDTSAGTPPNNYTHPYSFTQDGRSSGM